MVRSSSWPSSSSVIVTRPTVKNLVLHARLPVVEHMRQSEEERRRSQPPACLEKRAGGIEDSFRRIVARLVAERRRSVGAAGATLGRNGARRRRRKKKKTIAGGLNFYTLRETFPFDDVRGEREYTYNVFPSSGDVIVTGVPDLTHAERSLRLLRRRIYGDGGNGNEEERWKVVNGTYCGRVVVGDRSVCQMVSECEERGDIAEDVSVHFRSQSFPAVKIRFGGGGGGDEEDGGGGGGGRGTVNLFNNGNYVLVGASSEEIVEDNYAKLCALMQTCSTT